MNELVQHLSHGKHPVVADRYSSVEELKKSIERGLVLIKFRDTRGGTEIGVRIDNTSTTINSDDSSRGGNTLHLVGTLTLNYVKVRAIADVSLDTMEGAGNLEVLEPVSP